MASKHYLDSENVQQTYSSLTTAARAACAACADVLRSKISKTSKGDEVRNATMWTSNESVLTTILVKIANGYDIPTDCRERPLGRPTDRELGRHGSTNGPTSQR
jgi:hypothetical protein